jgi:hypothetical protein
MSVMSADSIDQPPNGTQVYDPNGNLWTVDEKGTLWDPATYKDEIQWEDPIHEEENLINRGAEFNPRGQLVFGGKIYDNLPSEGDYLYKERTPISFYSKGIAYIRKDGKDIPVWNAPSEAVDDLESAGFALIGGATNAVNSGSTIIATEGVSGSSNSSTQAASETGTSTTESESSAIQTQSQATATPGSGNPGAGSTATQATGEANTA